jgi:hypothetical protein
MATSTLSKAKATAATAFAATAAAATRGAKRYIVVQFPRQRVALAIRSLRD